MMASRTRKIVIGSILIGPDGSLTVNCSRGLECKY
jgi:hypothetical protein